MNSKYTVKVRVTGEFACFTRPDLKVERMSYPCMTPAAARGVLDSILWKPEFIWHVQRIYILNPIKFASIKRNEINDKQGRKPIIIEDARAQRNSIILRDVDYVIEAQIYQAIRDDKNPPEKYQAIFNRRIKRGQCFRRPYLGCREFAAEFLPAEDKLSPIAEDFPIGSMLLDIFFDEKGVPQPKFFYNATIRQGILEFADLYGEMLFSSHLRPVHTGEIGAVLYEFEGKENHEAEEI
jgi:CRISPR-associated protein Cas5d